MRRLAVGLAGAWFRARALFREYPALSAAAVNIAVVVLAYFGLAITGPELIFVVGAVTALCGVLVHRNVTPAAKPPVSEEVK
jgi:hypothetical protein